MRIKVDAQKCSGCHLCEMVCSLSHLGVINIQKSAIRIEKDDLDTSLNTPILCHQCKKMPCLEGEEVIAELEKGIFIWKRTRAERCLFHALPILDERAYHCDFCGGDPQCINVCTPKAILLQK
jgi:Fe-S-cluster-containing hydrogenase component 2